MTATRIDGKTPGGKRSLLADKIPLDTPFLIQIFPVYGCNFKCNYCIHSVNESDRAFISNKKVLDFIEYKKFIDDLKEFPNKVKMLRFAGTGEPLLHKQIAEMISYAKKSCIAESIDIVTNAEYLTKELSDKLIEAGLTTLRISLQGLNESSYLKTCGKKIDYNEFVNNIEYFYNNKKDTKVYIKIIDCAIESGEEDLFYNTFENICDYIAVEHVLPATDNIDYSDIIKGKSNLTQNGNDLQHVTICPQPFYMMQLNPDGNIAPCCAMETTSIMGNIYEQSAINIWNGKVFNEFRIKQLRNEKSDYNTCAKCLQYKYSMFKEDCLDSYSEKILKKMLKL